MLQQNEALLNGPPDPPKITHISKGTFDGSKLADFRILSSSFGRLASRSVAQWERFARETVLRLPAGVWAIAEFESRPPARLNNGA
jgi:hypothetical protein